MFVECGIVGFDQIRPLRLSISLKLVISLYCEPLDFSNCLEMHLKLWCHVLTLLRQVTHPSAAFGNRSKTSVSISSTPPGLQQPLILLFPESGQSLKFSHVSENTWVWLSVSSLFYLTWYIWVPASPASGWISFFYSGWKASTRTHILSHCLHRHIFFFFIPSSTDTQILHSYMHGCHLVPYLAC